MYEAKVCYKNSEDSSLFSICRLNPLISLLASAVGEGLSRSPQDFTADPLATIHGPELAKRFLLQAFRFFMIFFLTARLRWAGSAR
jgi:hypothetical protein